MDSPDHSHFGKEEQASLRNQGGSLNSVIDGARFCQGACETPLMDKSPFFFPFFLIPALCRGERRSPAYSHKENPVCENTCQPLYCFSYCL